VLSVRGWFGGMLFIASIQTAPIHWGTAQEGDVIQANPATLRNRGNARALLSAERSALNFLQLLSGTGHADTPLCDTVAGHPAQRSWNTTPQVRCSGIPASNGNKSMRFASARSQPARRPL